MFDNLMTVIYASIPLIAGITIPQVFKLWAAQRLGDKSIVSDFNPINQIHLYGTIIIPFVLIFLTNSYILFAFAKPININFNSIYQKKDRIIVHLISSIANLSMVLFWILIAIIFSILQKVFESNEINIPLFNILIQMASAGLMINVVFIAFNMIPLLPFDLGRIINEFLPHSLSVKFQALEPYHFFIILFLIFTPIFKAYISLIDNIIISIFVQPIINLLSL